MYAPHVRTACVALPFTGRKTGQLLLGKLAQLDMCDCRQLTAWTGGGPFFSMF